MFAFDNDLFEIEENESEFLEICSLLQKHPFKSPWAICFKTEDSNESTEKVFEFTLDNSVMKSKSTSQISPDNLCSSNSQNERLTSEEVKIDKEKMCRLKDSLMEAQDCNRTEQIQDLDILCTLPLSQISVLNDVLEISLLSETAVALLLNGILHLKLPISLAIATALVHYLVYPKVCEMKNCNTRTLLTAILHFSEVYPKAAIDEMMIPCLKKVVLEASQFEILFKMAKYNLPNEYIPCCTKNIIDYALPAENTFSILQCLIERKAEFEHSLLDSLTRKIQAWTASFNNNIKFTKLMTSVLSVYGSELTNQQILIYNDAIQTNKTIVKKAAENLIKKLKLETS